MMEENREIAESERDAEDFHGRAEVDVQELPGGWFSVFAFSTLHDIPPFLVHDDIMSGRFPAQRGNWMQGGSRIYEALDQKGQRAFYRAYHSSPEFQTCPDCPHGWQEA
jgi:hypothetical protein